MAATVEATIAELLFARLTSLALSPVLPVAFPDVAFSSPAGPYLRADFIPNRTDNLGLANDAKARHQGILQVMAIYPVNSGIIKPTNTAGLIASHFAKGTILYGSGVKGEGIRETLRRGSDERAGQGECPGHHSLSQLQLKPGHSGLTRPDPGFSL